MWKSRFFVIAIINKLTMPGIHKTIKVPTIIANVFAALTSFWCFICSVEFATISWRFFACNEQWRIKHGQLKLDLQSHLLQNSAINERIQNDNDDSWRKSDRNANHQKIIKICNDSQVTFVVKLSTVPSKGGQKSKQNSEDPAKNYDNFGSRCWLNVISDGVAHSPISVDRHCQQGKHRHCKHGEQKGVQQQAEMKVMWSSSQALEKLTAIAQR